MNQKPENAIDIARTAIAVVVVTSLLVISLAFDEIEVAGQVPLWTVQLRAVLIVWLFTFATLGHKRTRGALGNVAALAFLALIAPSTVFGDRSNLISLAGILAILIPARLLGLRLSRNAGSTIGWRPSILQLFAITGASAGVFTLGRLTYQNEVTLIAEFVWPFLLGAMLSSCGLVLLTNYALGSRLLMTCLVVAPVTFVLARPHQVDLELGAAVVAEISVTVGWCLAIFGATHSCGWARVSRKQEVVCLLPESAIAPSSS